ncbi:Uncharacterised protein [uncultured archaeon]|nr:Uncharacterised protein [uncultured archaeon]
MIRRKITYYIAFSAILLLLIISGCTSAPQKVTSSPTTPTPTLTPEPTPVPPTRSEIPVKPSLNITFYSTSVTGESNFTINWEVSGGTPGTISKTMILWGYKSGSGNITDYPRTSIMQTGQTPGTFRTDLTAPAGGGPIYFRAYALVDGTDIYSPEYQITIIPRYTGGGGGGGY